MTDAEPGSDTPPPAGRPGERLRLAREAQGLDLGDIGARTRIPQRHLEAIEAGTYSSLPSTTYAMGFARAYARAVGVDEVSLAADVRRELDRNWDRPVRTVPVYEVRDPARNPPRGIVWGGVLVAALLVLGLGLWFGTGLFRGGSPSGSPATPAGEVAVPIPQTVSPPPTPGTGGQVTITATDEVWVRVYDAKDTSLFMKTMAPGERYDVPPDADAPEINVGRPDKLAITVNGSAVPPLGDGRVAIKDVSLTAASLLARGGGASPGASPTPATRPTPAAAARPTPRASGVAPAAPTAAEPAAGNATDG